jgi:hypothetical protein
VHRDEILPEMLAATGVCAEFCARPEIWPIFEGWIQEEYPSESGDETVSRDFLIAASRILLVLIQRMEAEMIADRFRDLLSENLPGWAGSSGRPVPVWIPASSSPRGPRAGPRPSARAAR